jgi:NAD(P)-dependent dehydrogenase (short-subunit alcohol dehydrogenase family)
MPAETRDLTDSVVLVTGAGAGIGAATASLLLEAGARVILADLEPARATAVAEGDAADHVLVQRMDVRSPADARAAFADGVGRTADDPIKNSYLLPFDVGAAVVTVLQQPRRMRTALWTLWSMSENA